MRTVQNTLETTAPDAAAPLASPRLLKFLLWIQAPIIVVTIVLLFLASASIPKLLQRRQELLQENNQLNQSNYVLTQRNGDLKANNDLLAKKSQQLLQNQIYSSAVKSAVKATVSGPVKLDDLLGNWKNTDKTTRGLTRLSIRVDGERVFVHVWEACHPTDCDWGEVEATPYAQNVSSSPSQGTVMLGCSFKTNFEKFVVTIHPLSSAAIQVETVTRFTDGSERSSYAADYSFHRAT